MEPHRTITKEEYEAFTDEARKEEEGMLIIATPEEDTRIVEELLDMPAGSFGESFITIRANQVVCSYCGRQPSFLDVLGDSVGFHGKEFNKEIFEGKRGYIENPNTPFPHKCYRCKQESPVVVMRYWRLHYWCKKRH